MAKKVVGGYVDADTIDTMDIMIRLGFFNSRSDMINQGLEYLIKHFNKRQYLENQIHTLKLKIKQLDEKEMLEEVLIE